MKFILQYFLRQLFCSLIEFNPNPPTHGGSFNPPTTGGNNGGNTKSATNPSLITSTGGLFGTSGLLMTPYITPKGQCFIVVHDYTNFNCEEDMEYDYPEEIPPVQYRDGRDATWNLIILKYRELGEVNFNINLSWYNKINDMFSYKSIPISITNPYKKNKRNTFPDKKIHTKYIPFVINGERPQVKVFRSADAGPLSITKLIVCGSADELPQT